MDMTGILKLEIVDKEGRIEYKEACFEHAVKAVLDGNINVKDTDIDIISKKDKYYYNRCDFCKE